MSREKSKVEKLTGLALIEVDLLKDEYEQIVKKTRKVKKNSNFKDIEFITDDDIDELYGKRKRRKYAALTVELYAIVEQLLEDIYYIFNTNKYVKTPKKNKVDDLQAKISCDVSFGEEKQMKFLADVRNFIVHDKFCFKKAKESSVINEVYGSKNLGSKRLRELFAELLDDVELYINAICAKEKPII